MPLKHNLTTGEIIFTMTTLMSESKYYSRAGGCAYDLGIITITAPQLKTQ